ncbi:hypothetical protein QFA96_22855 [Pseudomonas sp. Ap32]|nr:hypothetical protein QFA96_22855 [Pseudomonas sp. Ap32]
MPFNDRLGHVVQHHLSVAFYLVAISGFGAFVTTLQGHWVNPFGVMLHAGLVAYAWARRGHAFS